MTYSNRFSNCSDGDGASPLPLRRTLVSAAGRQHQHQQRLCLSAIWADRPAQQTSKRERRRAIYSWSIGYGTLSDIEEVTAGLGAGQGPLFKKGKVADNVHRQTAEPRGRRLVASTASPHVSQSGAATAATRRTSRQNASTPATAPSSSSASVAARVMPSIKSLVGGASSAARRRDSDVETQMPLVSKDYSTSTSSKTAATGGAILKQCASLANLRKCETVFALTAGGQRALRSASSSNSVLEPLQPINRLRGGSNQRLCSRCSSLLTLASSSKYSLSSCAGFVPVAVVDDDPSGGGGGGDGGVGTLLCKLCLAEVPSRQAYHIQQCNCSFCLECMTAYVKFEIAEGAYDISCPDARCPEQGVLQQEEIKRLVGEDQFEKHKKYRLNREIEIDQNRTWCPRAGCETVCDLCPVDQPCRPQSVLCPTCTANFCSNCKLEWHEGMTCEQHAKRLAEEGKAEEPGIPFDSDLIKCCPMCNVPIEKDEGCAQMMCKRCKHVFCWYCLASLDDDFLLRHYDKGPCKNKLGHSRASVMWHRTQVIGIFAGFGILLLVASPLLLLAAPCIVCCKCRICNAGNAKMENEESSSSERP